MREYQLKGLYLARANHLESLQLESLRSLGMQYYYGIHQIDSALLLFNQAVVIAERMDSFNVEDSILSEMTDIGLKISNYPLAVESSRQNLRLREERGHDSLSIGNAYKKIGQVYLHLEEYNLSIAFLKRAGIFLSGIHDHNNLIFTMDWLGACYASLHKKDSALYFIQKALDLIPGSSMGYKYGGLYNDLGLIYSMTGNDSLAMAYFRKRLPFFYLKGVSDESNICESLQGMAELFEKNGENDSAFVYAQRTYNIARRNSYLHEIMDASQILAKQYKEKNVLDSAFFYLQTAMTIHDSIFSQQRIQAVQNIAFQDQQQQELLHQAEDRYHNRIRMYFLIGVILFALLLAVFFWRNSVIKQRSNNKLSRKNREIETQKGQIEQSYRELKSTQAKLVESEKMAFLGELTAGIAHEIQNPLNFVNNFSEVNEELLEELNQGLDQGNLEQIKGLTSDLKQNMEKIAFHGKRADAIVKNMLLHSRASSEQKTPTNLNDLADEYFRLSYHGLRAKDKTFNATMETDFDGKIGMVPVVSPDIGRVLLNLFNNAFYSVTEKGTQGKPGYQGIVSVSTKNFSDHIEIRIRDNGMGIPSQTLSKIFQPFFTTKAAGKGTGLGLSISYDIITKGHGGSLEVDSRQGEYAEFLIKLPV